MRRRRPYRTAIQVLSPCATHPRTPRRPPNRDVAVRAPRRPCAAIGRRASPPPHRAHAVDGCDPLLKARTPTKGLGSPPRALPRASSCHCRRQRRRRRAPSSSRLYRQCVLLRPALGPPVATLLAYCSDRAASSPEFELPRPPPGKPCRAHAPACSPSQWALVASPLGHTGALCITYCSVGPFPSLDFAPPRLCCPGAAAAARRRPLQPGHHRQSLSGEPSRFPRRSLAYPGTPSPPASSSSPSVPRRGKVRT
jgi:hypothetical protein